MRSFGLLEVRLGRARGARVCLPLTLCARCRITSAPCAARRSVIMFVGSAAPACQRGDAHLQLRQGGCAELCDTEARVTRQKVRIRSSQRQLLRRGLHTPYGAGVLCSCAAWGPSRPLGARCLGRRRPAVSKALHAPLGARCPRCCCSDGVSQLLRRSSTIAADALLTPSYRLAAIGSVFLVTCWYAIAQSGLPFASAWCTRLSRCGESGGAASGYARAAR